ncbi:MAG: hypothetical protein ACYC7D_12245 [Nitrososphaerales archaeon]
MQSYNCGAGSSSGTSQLTIKTQNTSGGPITGYYAVLNQSGTVMASGLTPTSFTLNNGQTHTVQVDNYSSCNFAYWADTGSTIFYRTVSISNNTSYTAVINCGASTSSASSSTGSSSASSSSTTSSSSTKSSSSVTTTSSTSTNPLRSSSTTSSSVSVTTSSTKSTSSVATSNISQTTLATTSTQASGTITLFIAIVVVVIVIVALAGLFLRRGKSNSS